MALQTLDYSLTALKVPGLVSYTPPFGTKKPDGSGLTTAEINRAVLMPFMKQRSISGVPISPDVDPPMGVISEDSLATPIEFDATFAVGAGVSLQLADPSYEGQKLTVVGSFAAEQTAATIILGVSGSPEEISLMGGKALGLVSVAGKWTRFNNGGQDREDVTEVVNAASYHPGTGVGGITWTDPAIDFDHIEIEDQLNQGVFIEIAPRVQKFVPPAGQHQYVIRVVFVNQSKSEGVELPLEMYSIVYTANLVSATIPQNNPNRLILTFDNLVSASSAEGLSLDGISDSLSYVDQVNAESLGFQLSSKMFISGSSYTVNYTGSGTIKQDDASNVAAWNTFAVTNNSQYVTATLQSAQIPSAEPSTLVLVFGKAVKDIDPAKFSLSGTTATITSLISPTSSNSSATVAFQLSKPVAASETTIKVSMITGGAVDSDGQAVPVFENDAVTNNSDHVGFTLDSAEIPANDPSILVVVMEGAVTIGETTSGLSAPLGWSLMYGSGEGNSPTLTEWTISDGTIIFALSSPVLAGKHPTLSYDGSDPTFKAVSTGNPIEAFSQAVTNNSVYTGGILPGSEPRNLALTLLGHEVTGPADVTSIINSISETVRSGSIGNFVLGDYFGLYSLTIEPDASGGGFGRASNETIPDHGRWLDFMVVSKNGFKGKNGNNADHVILHSRNLLSNAIGHCMDSLVSGKGYLGCDGQAYVINRVLPGLQNAGIPFSTNKILSLIRKVANGGSEATRVDTITDRLWLPTEWEMFGTNIYSWSSGAAAENSSNQGRLEYYQSNLTRLKCSSYPVQNSSPAFHSGSWWLASPYYKGSNYCWVTISGNDHMAGNAADTEGIAPAFAVG